MSSADIDWPDCVKIVFRLYDEDGNGMISRDELESLVRELDPHFPRDEFDNVFKSIDLNGDGQLQFEEFVNFLYGSGDELVSKVAAGVKHLCSLPSEALPEHGRAADVPQDIEKTNKDEGDGENGDADECPLCFSDFWRPVETPCKHRFCFECLMAWLAHRKTCPMCRGDLKRWKPKPMSGASQADEERQRTLDREREESEAAYRLHLAATHGEAAAARREARARSSRAEEETRAQEEADRELARIRRLEEIERMRPDQERIKALVPDGEAFELRVGHRLYGSGSDRFGGGQVMFVEPVLKGLPLSFLIQEVKFHTRPLINPSSRGRMYYTVASKGPRSFEARSNTDHIDPSFKVHILWKDGFGLAPLSMEIRTRLTGTLSAFRQIAVELPALSSVDKAVRRDMTAFRNTLNGLR